MNLPKTLVALALLVLVVNVAEARAAEPWTAPLSIEGSTGAHFPDLAFAPGGTGLAGWSSGGALPDSGSIVSAPVSPQGTAGAARTAASGFLATRLRAYGSNRVIVAGSRYVGVPRPYWATGRTTGALGPARRLAPYGYVADLAVNAKGAAAVALRVCESRRRCRRPVPAVVLRRPGRRFGKPIVLGRAPVSAMAVDINARGDVLAVWDRPLNGSSGRRGVYATIRTAGGRRATQRIGFSQPIPSLSAAIGAGRAAVVGWKGQRVSEGDPGSPAEVWVADAAAGRRFNAAKRVEQVPNLGTGHYVGQAGVRVAIAGDGRKLAAWTGHENGRFVVRAARVEGGETRDPAQQISDPAKDTVLGDLATGPAGEAVAMLLTGIRGADPSGPVGVYAATRTPGSNAFGTLEQVASEQGFREAVRAQIAPTTGRVVAVWRDLDAQAVRIASRPTLAPGAYALPG